jgi:hypothetical protein
MRISLGPALAIAVVAIVLGIVGGAWWWWSENADKLKDAGEAVFEEGRKAGMALRESGCVEKALERHRVAENRSILGTIRTNLFLRACLDASGPEAAFCDGVPAKGEIMAIGVWAGQRCLKAGFTDTYCGQIFSQLTDYCSSSERASKRPPIAKP